MARDRIAALSDAVVAAANAIETHGFVMGEDAERRAIVEWLGDYVKTIDKPGQRALVRRLTAQIKRGEHR